MSFKLEDLPYQRQAISAVVRLFDGQQRNYFDLQLQGDCFPNRLDLTRQEIVANLEKIAAENGISHGEASVCIHPDYCIEMETGTGKTLVYLRTIYELCREYGFTKFIILVPSVPIREGVLDTIESFRTQLERLYNIPLHAFEYDSKKNNSAPSRANRDSPEDQLISHSQYPTPACLLKAAGRGRIIQQVNGCATSGEVDFLIVALAILAERQRTGAAEYRSLEVLGRLPGAINAKGELEVPAPVDHVTWTEQVAGFANRDDLGTAPKVLVHTGNLSQATTAGFMTAGWKPVRVAYPVR